LSEAENPVSDKGNKRIKITMISILLSVLSIILIFTTPGYSQNDVEADQFGTVSGVVLQKGKREPVSYVNVTIKELRISKMTDEKGEFYFNKILPGKYTIIIQDQGVEPFSQSFSLEPGKAVKLKCYITRAAIILDEVVVLEEKEKASVADKVISKDEIVGIPGAANDAIRAVESFPGVVSTPVGGFGNGLVIRGTSPEDSRYLLNGFEIPQLFHFGALISIINTELVDSITYNPGGYGVSKRGALGGVIEVASRGPRRDRFGGVLDLATYSSYVLFEGPAGEKFSWAGAARRSFIDFILPEVVPKEDLQFTLAPRFYDYTGIFEYFPNNHHTLTAMFLGSDDRLGLLSEPDVNDPFNADSFDITISWHRGDIRWNFAPNERFINSLSTQFRTQRMVFNFGKDMFFQQDVLVASLREDLSVMVGKWNELRFGIETDYYDGVVRANIISPPKEGQPGVSFTNEDTIELSVHLDAYDVEGYIDDVMEPAKWLKIIPGIRVGYLDLINYFSYDPRLILKFFPTEKSSITTSAGIYNQWPAWDEMSDNFGTTNLGSETAYQGSMGAGYDFGQGWTIDIQGYYKDLDNLISSTKIGDEEPYDNQGVGYVYGGELLARKHLSNRLFGWVSYTYSQSRRKDRPSGDWRYFDQDQTHNFIILGSYMLGENKQWRLGAKWQLSTGLPYTKVDGAIYNADTDSYLPIYSEQVNGRREPLYHQLDIRADKLWIFNRWTLNTYLDVQNVYWQEYSFGYEYNFDYTERRAVTFPPFMPSIGMQARF